ncbi:TPA: hypothetical protein M2Q89_004858 [Escherichia coli]|nr:hypothetical protein [Escherichia coli]
MLIFWSAFFSVLVSMLSIASGYNERSFFFEQNKIIKENMYVDYLTASATVLANICSDSSVCKNMKSLPKELSEPLENTLSNSGYVNSITINLCIYNNQVIAYTTDYFNISRYPDNLLSYISSLSSDTISFCEMGNESAIAFVKAIKE